VHIPSSYLRLSNRDPNGAVVRGAVGDLLAGYVLGLKSAKLPSPYREGLASTQARLRQRLVEEGRAHGAGLDVYSVLREIIGADALLHFAALVDADLFLRRVYGAPLPDDVEGQRISRRRESNPPFTLLTSTRGGFPAVPVIVAPDPDEPTEYTEWAPYRLAMEAAGATEQGIRAFAKSFWLHRKRHRVRVDGRIERLSCLPLGAMLCIIHLLGTGGGEWLKSEHRAQLARASHENRAALEVAIDREVPGWGAMFGRPPVRGMESE
jgi:catechol 2,3-dioxygenase-like lactoylglutathione lyase family enzyme